MIWKYFNITVEILSTPQHNNISKKPRHSCSWKWDMRICSHGCASADSRAYKSWGSSGDPHSQATVAITSRRKVFSGIQSQQHEVSRCPICTLHSCLWVNFHFFNIRDLPLRVYMEFWSVRHFQEVILEFCFLLILPNLDALENHFLPKTR